ncbi:MAG: branched-chain amino acid transport system permease protein livM [Frankiaceae bacterium]|nr:branched-chain amino acid transport system permease protein livM [Frankiaceae bacterium]
MLALNYALAGLGLGAIAALSGVGLLVTYRATGVFNVAHGAVAMMAAYLFWELTDQWGTPRWVAAALILMVVAPAFGVALERVVFRPLQRWSATAAESLVATIGLLVLLVGLAFVLWGAQFRHPSSLFPQKVLHPGSLTVHIDAFADLAVVVVGTLAVGLVLALTPLGTQIRAVVDRRELAELSGVDADRVSAIGWAIGSVFAALTGILLASQLALDPFNLTLVVLETFAMPVLAGLTSIPIAIAAGIALGVGQSEMNLWSPSNDQALSIWNALHANLPIVLLLVALLVRSRLAEAGGDAGSTTTFGSRRAVEPSVRRLAAQYTVAAIAMFLPLTFSDVALRQAQQIPALAIVFVSIVAVTGYSGQISLGQAGYAGLGALFFAKVSTSTPQLVALLVAAVAAGIVGFLTGYPAIRRRGLFLALTTFAVGAFVSRFVFAQPYFTNNLDVQRPSLFGLSLEGDRAFYLFELAMLAVAFLVMYNLRNGALGRSLVALRDSEEGARSVGVDVRALKILIFTVSAMLAGLGGALLAQRAQAFDPSAFDPLAASLPWFAVVVVFGADSAAAAVIGAAFIVLVNGLTGQANAYLIPVGLLAAFLGRLPGGAAELSRRFGEWLSTPTALLRHYAAATPAPAPPPVLSARGRAALDRLRAARSGEVGS